MSTTTEPIDCNFVQLYLDANFKTMLDTMELKFGEILAFCKIPDGNDIDTGEYGFAGDLAKGGIYMAFAGEIRNDKFVPSRLLYIGKAEDNTNSLGKRIDEHGRVLKGQSESDHARWRRIAKLGGNESIGYCYAALDDMKHIDDIESKLIYNNQPPCNDKKKENDCSSDKCPFFRISFQHEYACTKHIVGNDSIKSFLRGQLS